MLWHTKAYIKPLKIYLFVFSLYLHELFIFILKLKKYRWGAAKWTLGTNHNININGWNLHPPLLNNVQGLSTSWQRPPLKHLGVKIFYFIYFFYFYWNRCIFLKIKYRICRKSNTTIFRWHIQLLFTFFFQFLMIQGYYIGRYVSLFFPYYPLV